ncbi:MAG: hypothetical protein ACOYNO_13450 [Saprospiraceae bacterium]
MTSLPNLISAFAIVAGVLTFLTKRAGRTDNVLMSYLQYFTGVWFVFSGLVKAVDPIGTAYKMEDYFVQFEQTFAGLNNVFKGLAPLFPWLTQFGNGFSIFMIVLEIVLGVMLIIGYLPKVASWLFFLVVLFFTFLTGFTYLTGYVPAEANFFDFAKWGPYIKTQMRVTDCGCFGDFIKLNPRTSFFKDIALMLPALYFVFFSSKMHELFSRATRMGITVGVTLLSLLLCIQNTYWNDPMIDFRPFKKGANIREQKALEEEARGNMEITGWLMENTKDGKVVVVDNPDYKAVAAQYPKDQGWKVKDQIKTEPFIEKDGKRVFVKETKISDFAVEDGENGEVTEDLLNEEGYSMMIVAYHLHGVKAMQTVTERDSVWAIDTLPDGTTQRRLAEVQTQEIEKEVLAPDAEYARLFTEKINPLAEQAKKAGWKVYAITTYQDAEVAQGFAQAVGATYPFYKADDKLLKTIMRAEPGIVILKNGVVVEKYHQKHFPASFQF